MREAVSFGEDESVSKNVNSCSKLGSTELLPIADIANCRMVIIEETEGEAAGAKLINVGQNTNRQSAVLNRQSL